MTEMERFSQIATQLHAEESDLIPAPLPFHARNTYHFEQGGYVCRDNGTGCGKAFPTREAKNRHRQWCKQVTA
jgi:hypothetical protein